MPLQHSAICLPVGMQVKKITVIISIYFPLLGIPSSEADLVSSESLMGCSAGAKAVLGPRHCK